MRVLLFVAAALQVHAATVNVTVRVIDESTLAPVPGMRIRIFESSAAGSRAVNAYLSTGLDGTFTAELPAPGNFMIAEIEIDGYVPSKGSTRRLRTQVDSRPMTVTLTVARTGTISGRVVDADTGDPLPDVAVQPLQASYGRGRREVNRDGAKPSVTDKEGIFRVANLRSGDYVLEVNSYLADAKKPLQSAKGYPLVIWPGGDLQTAMPFNLSYGGTVRIGDVKLRRQELPALSIAVVGGTCASGQTYEVNLSQYSLSSVFTRAAAHVPCGETAKMDNVTPGDYELEAQAQWQPEVSRERGAWRVHVTDRDQKVEVPVTAPITISGKVALDRADTDATRALPAGLTVNLRPRGSKMFAYFGHIPSFGSKVLAGGLFEGRSYVPAGGEIQVQIGSLRPPYYLKELRYNGAAQAGDVFLIEPGTARQELEVILSDRAASLSGSVRTADAKIVSDAAVLLIPWPADVATAYPQGLEEFAAENGSYSFTGLRPGSYRAIAVDKAVRQKLEEPGVMLSLFDSAETFELKEAGAAVRQVAPVSPAR